jgi:sporulation integral membrane protein YtvI
MGFVTSLVTGILNTAISIPQAIVFVIVTVLSTYFLSSDRDRIFGFLASQFPESWAAKARSIKKDMFSALFGYIRAQLILMSITFLELYAGFALIGIKHPLILALLISVIDALPILGTGGILAPWAAYSFLTGNMKMGFSILALYGVVWIVRQLMEPKVLGQQIGVHPLLTLMAMYTGLQLLGIPGLIVGPITMLLLKNILTGILKGRTLKEMLFKS